MALNLSQALRNYNMVTGSVEADKLRKFVDQPLAIRSYTLKKSPGAEISCYTMIDTPDHEKPLGTASDQIYADLAALASFVKQVPGVEVEIITGGVSLDQETGEVFEGKQITRVSFPETDMPLFILRQIETGNSGRTVFKIEAYDPMEPATAKPE